MMAEKEKEKQEGNTLVEEKATVEITAAEQVANNVPIAEPAKEVEKVPAQATQSAPAEVIETKPPISLENWVPDTSVGKRVYAGEITDIDTVLGMGVPIREPEIIDKLVPDLKNEVILIGGRTGKGGGVQRIPVKITAKMHRSGRRLSTSAFVVVGNEDGLVGVGGGHAIEARDAIAKAIQRAKLNLVRVRRGCGSWECRCGTQHTVAFKTTGKSGSVRVELLPAPKGIGLVSDDESKKILRLAGIKDVWVRTFGNTSARINLINAIYDALKKLYEYEREEGVVRKKIIEETEEDNIDESEDQEINEEEIEEEAEDSAAEESEEESEEEESEEEKE